MPWSWVDTEYSILRVRHTPSTAYTNSTIHRVQHPPKIVRLPFILMTRSWPRNIFSDSSVPPYMIDRHLPGLHDSSKEKSHCPIPTVASWLTDESNLSTRRGIHRPPPSPGPIPLSHCLGVHIQTLSIMASHWGSKLAQLRPPSSHNQGLQVHLQTRSIMASKCICPSSLNHGLPVHFQTH